MENNYLGQFRGLITPYELNKGDLTSKSIKDNYPQIVSSEIATTDNLYMMPLSIDTLVLYYNKDIFDSEMVPTPPTS